MNDFHSSEKAFSPWSISSNRWLINPTKWGLTLDTFINTFCSYFIHFKYINEDAHEYYFGVHNLMCLWLFPYECFVMQMSPRANAFIITRPIIMPVMYSFYLVFMLLLWVWNNEIYSVLASDTGHAGTRSLNAFVKSATYG